MLSYIQENVSAKLLVLNKEVVIMKTMAFKVVDIGSAYIQTDIVSINAVLSPMKEITHGQGVLL